MHQGQDKLTQFLEAKPEPLPYQNRAFLSYQEQFRIISLLRTRLMINLMLERPVEYISDDLPL